MAPLFRLLNLHTCRCGLVALPLAIAVVLMGLRPEVLSTASHAGDAATTAATPLVVTGHATLLITCDQGRVLVRDEAGVLLAERATDAISRMELTARDRVAIDGDLAVAGKLTIQAERIAIGAHVLTLGGLALSGRLVEIHDGAVLDASSPTGGGRIEIGSAPAPAGLVVIGQRAQLRADALADGQGGIIAITADKLIQGGWLSVDALHGDGGSITVALSESGMQLDAAGLSARGALHGGNIRVQGGCGPAGRSGNWFLSGTLDASGASGNGGSVTVLAERIALAATTIDATGDIHGGTVIIGGPAHGGGDLPRAHSITINHAAHLVADARRDGDGGNIVIWSDADTRFLGQLSARGGTNGGAGGTIEVSSAGTVSANGHTDTSAPRGNQGVLLLDPRNIVISTTTGVCPQFELFDPHPAANNHFGTIVTPLSTGKVMIVAPDDDLSATDAGAVYLFNGLTGSLISTLVGASANDRIGAYGVTALSNGNFVVSSKAWSNGANAFAGAVTWGSGTTGMTGVVSAANSLVGSAANDQVGIEAITVLSNGNYVVNSRLWDNGATVNAGAVTWGNGASGTSGVVSAANSLVGSSTNDGVGSGLVHALTNGHYVVSSPGWDGVISDVGAVTWCNGTSGRTGTISAANSLVGGQSGDYVGASGGNSGGVVALTNGNYVVCSYAWANGAIMRCGAVTWCDGAAGRVGLVSTANSIYGDHINDEVGLYGASALTNGHYVVSSSSWNNNQGAVTWGNGTTGTIGVVSSANSLVATGSHTITVLTNGHYVVACPYVSITAGADGAVTWCNGANGSTTGTVSAANSLVGSHVGDNVGIGFVTALTNGNYLVPSYTWNNTRGAVTLCNGAAGTIGVVSAANSLVGSSYGDYVGGGMQVALSNGNYVVGSSSWNNGALASAGAVTWGDGVSGVSGAVSAANSLVGDHASDFLGGSNDGVKALTNGDYLICAPNWNGVGAVLRVDGTAGITGTIDPATSIVGQGGGYIGSVATVLSDGNAVVNSFAWAYAPPAPGSTGAVTWIDGATGGTLDRTLTVNLRNSVTGTLVNAEPTPIVEDTVNQQVLAAFPTDGGGRVVALVPDPNLFTYVRAQAQDVALQPSFLTRSLDAGTTVTLQASNDLTLGSALAVNHTTGTGGALTLQAGRSLLLNANLVSDDGDVTLIANDLLASGVVNAQRSAGAAVIAMAGGTSIDAGNGAVTIAVRAGTGKTNTTSGNLLLRTISAQALSVSNSGPTAGSGITQSGVWTVPGAITLQTGTNNVSLTGTVIVGDGSLTSSAATTQVSGTLGFDLAGTGQMAATGLVSLSNPVLLLIAHGPSATGAIRTIVLNDGSDAVTGTFLGLSEGAVYNVESQPFSISYLGGTSNDVTLTALGAPGTPVITWAQPAAIQVGTALSATQLNASATVAGSFVYHPPAGTLLGIGTHTLSVRFTPSTTMPYVYATKSVTLTVTPLAGTPAISSASTTAGTVGTPFLYQITASNVPTSYAATGLPAGLSCDTGTGIISGTPTVAGVSVVTIWATNAIGTGQASLTVTIIPPASDDGHKKCGFGSLFGAVMLTLMLALLRGSPLRSWLRAPTHEARPNEDA